MRAAVHSHYGPPDVVQISEVEKPVPADGEVMIKVRAAAVNPLDRFCMCGIPYVARAVGGPGNLRRPKDVRLGVDVAGRVEAAGRNVTQFRPGDEVFGMCKGAFAEYACAPESAVVLKPETVTFEQAAAAPVAAYTALQGLRDKGRIRAGQQVLINGAAGGVGTFAVQIAKWFGAEVTGVCSSKNVELARSIGADRVIDYTEADFTRSSERYDLLFDCIGNHSFAACRRVLRPDGMHVVVGASSQGRWIGPIGRMLRGVALSRFAKWRIVTFIARSGQKDLAIIAELMASGKVTPVIDRCYRLDETPEAIRHLETKHARGKVIIVLP
jgi:NADPH:quinone reductase-like Zn-dependent oxidoreductase